MTRNEYHNLADMLHGGINRMCVTHEFDELDCLYSCAKSYLARLYSASVERLQKEHKEELE